MAKKIKPTAERLLDDLMKLHIPAEYLKYFDLHEVRDKPDCYELVLHEKEGLIPKELKDRDVVLDGFCNPVNIVGHSFSIKKIYLIAYRRRWKERNSGKHCSNEYDLHPTGAKITRSLADFLKEAH